MNKSELIDEVHSAATGDVDKKDVATVIDNLIDVVERAVARGDKVTIPGFGAWSRTERAARTGREVLGWCQLQVRREQVGTSPAVDGSTQQ